MRMILVFSSAVLASLTLTVKKIENVSRRAEVFVADVSA